MRIPVILQQYLITDKKSDKFLVKKGLKVEVGKIEYIGGPLNYKHSGTWFKLDGNDLYYEKDDVYLLIDKIGAEDFHMSLFNQVKGQLLNSEEYL